MKHFFINTIPFAIFSLLVFLAFSSLFILGHDIYKIEAHIYDKITGGRKGSIDDELWSKKIPYIYKMADILSEAEKSKVQEK